MHEYVDVECPYCGQSAEIDVDPFGGRRQHYVQDCPTCCQPWDVSVTQDIDGDWSVALKTDDS